MTRPKMATVSARVDPAIKEEATAVLAEIGLTVPDAIRMLLEYVAANKKLPFDTTMD